MATISKFYLLDAATPNTGTMPTNSPTTIAGGVVGAGTEATGASTARDATDVAGISNPDLESTITAAATQVQQRLGHRRFVSRPLAANVFTTSDGLWTFSYARFQSNTLHVGQIFCTVYPWRPSSGLRVGTHVISFAGGSSIPTSETAEAISGNWGTAGETIVNGDCLVFDIYSQFTQGMSTAYTDSFSYNGTTEASTTTCASFVTPPAALTLFTATTEIPDVYVARIRS